MDYQEISFEGEDNGTSGSGGTGKQIPGTVSVAEVSFEGEDNGTSGSGGTGKQIPGTIAAREHM